MVLIQYLDRLYPLERSTGTCCLCDTGIKVLNKITLLTLAFINVVFKIIFLTDFLISTRKSITRAEVKTRSPFGDSSGANHPTISTKIHHDDTINQGATLLQVSGGILQTLTVDFVRDLFPSS